MEQVKGSEYELVGGEVVRRVKNIDGSGDSLISVNVIGDEYIVKELVVDVVDGL